MELTHTERLERWAVALEACEAETLSPFLEVELMEGGALAPLRQWNSPLAVAYKDPVLRRGGLGSDRYGEGTEFFGLTRGQAHWLLCNCGYLGAMRSREVARRIRAILTRESRRAWRPANPIPALVRWISGWVPLAGAGRSA